MIRISVEYIRRQAAIVVVLRLAVTVIQHSPSVTQWLAQSGWVNERFTVASDVIGDILFLPSSRMRHDRKFRPDFGVNSARASDLRGRENFQEMLVTPPWSHRRPTSLYDRPQWDHLSSDLFSFKLCTKITSFGFVKMISLPTTQSLWEPGNGMRSRYQHLLLDCSDAVPTYWAAALGGCKRSNDCPVTSPSFCYIFEEEVSNGAVNSASDRPHIGPRSHEQSFECVGLYSSRASLLAGPYLRCRFEGRRSWRHVIGDQPKLPMNVTSIVWHRVSL